MIERLGRFWATVSVILILAAVLLSINQLFYLKLFGFNPIFEAYLYYLLACFVPLAFLLWPAKKSGQIQKVQWYDAILFIVALISFLYLAVNGNRIVLMGWDTTAPTLATIASFLLWIVILEGVRRVAGLVLMLVCLFFSLFPMITGHMPISFLQGIPLDFKTTATSHIMSLNSVLGVPMKTLGNLLIGFLIFGAVLVNTGGGDFFFKLAQSLFGRQRGGTAKVAVIGSAFFGMLSGSAVSNVVTTGSMTIPAMKKSGYKNHYAAGVEATASTGGTITPPIMGSAAFIMASFLAIPYAEIALAAAIPAMLYFLGILVQVDGYAAKNKLIGIPKNELPSFWKTVKESWVYIIATLLLVYLIFVTKNEAQAPYYVSLFLILGAFFRKETRFNFKKAQHLILDGGKLMAEITTILAAVGFIVGALSITGVAFAFSRELIAAAGGSALLILLAGAVTSFILGMGMTVSAVYIFLAMIMAPALVRLGFDPVASHLFVIYWATVSYITPPVALAAYAASGIAKADPIRTGFTAMRLGAVKYIVPLFFVYNPALIGRAEPFEIIITFIFAVLGVWWLSSALEGHLLGIGALTNVFVRIIIGVAGLLAFFPQLLTDIIGLILMAIVYGWYFMRKKKSQFSVSA
ncbi:C4-dicarboxylate ABC transporter [Pueribacillus theae]|uniref:C4-dicarboxylate ABC transporter n=1 Tax=Pueribacillus theae TaxID=2171751 RepID=A0A2U1JRG5_9BACI|nr:TRAP transporter fused permease subunit [Pueribacillus theae]PWA07712.1 C4-dicarboxylate ABC transporter [Pueribacillus theae]